MGPPGRAHQGNLSRLDRETSACSRVDPLLEYGRLRRFRLDPTRTLIALSLGLVLVLALSRTWQLDRWRPLSIFGLGLLLGMLYWQRHALRRVADRAGSARMLLLLLVLGWVARLGFAVGAQVEPVSDFALNLQLAKTLAIEGRYALDGEPYALREPGIAFLGSLFHRVGIAPVFGMTVLNATLSAGAAIPVFLWARDLGGKAAAASAAFFAAFLPSLVFGAALIGREPVFIGLVSWYWYLSSRIDAGESRAYLIVALGLLAGLSAYVRGEAAALPFACLGVGVVLGPDRLRRAWSYALAGFIALLVLLPWGIRNHSTFGEFWLLSSAVGHGSWLANNPNATGGPILESDLPEGLPRDEVLRDRVGREKAAAWARENPRAFLALIPKKLSAMLSTQHDSVSMTHVHSRRARPMLHFSHALTQVAYLLVLFLALFAVTRPAPLPSVRLQAAVTAFGFVILPRVWFHGQPRYHVAIVPVLCMLAGLAFVLTASRQVRPAEATP